MQTDGRNTVVFIESAAAMGGVQYSTLYLVQALDKLRWRPIVVCPTQGELTRACTEAGVETEIVSYSGWWSTSVSITQRVRLPNPFAWVRDFFSIARTARKLERFLAELSPNLVVTKGLSAHFIGGLAARKLGIPCVWHAQDFISERNLGIYRHIFSAAARRLPQHIIVDGEPIQRQLPRSLRSRTTVIHNGIDTNRFKAGHSGSVVRDELGIPKDHIVVGHVGRLTSWKGQHYLIEAFARLAGNYPNVTLLLVGAPVFADDAYEQRLRDMAAGSGFQDRIKFRIDQRELERVLEAMDIFAFTSVEKDTSPLSLLSAMSSGLPIVAFDIEGVRELAGREDCFRTVPVGETKSLAESLQNLIGNEKDRLRLGQAARQAVIRNFSLEQHVKQVESVLVQASALSPTANTEKNEYAVVGEERDATSRAIPA